MNSQEWHIRRAYSGLHNIRYDGCNGALEGVGGIDGFDVPAAKAKLAQIKALADELHKEVAEASDKREANEADRYSRRNEAWERARSALPPEDFALIVGDWSD